MKIDKFLEELANLTNKYGIYIESTEFLYIADERDEIGNVYCGVTENGKYIYVRNLNRR